MTDQGRRRRNSDVQVTRYTHDVKEPGTPETGHTRLMPGEEQIVSVPMDNGWTSALNVGKLEDGQEHPVVVDMDPVVDPVLFWAGKKSQRDIPILPLQRNEIVSESRIAQIVERARRASNNGAIEQMALFGDLERKLREEEKGKRVEFYTHQEGWKNKLICGDSLLVMESMIHYEGLKGGVQVVYMDPPYGISYDSNFQQRIDSTKNDDKDKGDDVLTIKAFRDTWTLGIHSYMSYLRDRMYLARELMRDSGSIFVQINDTNVHLIRVLMDEVFGRANFCSQISFVKTSFQSAQLLTTTSDYLVWYAKDKSKVKFNKIYKPKIVGVDEGEEYKYLYNPETRSITHMTREQYINPSTIPSYLKPCRYGPLTSQGSSGSSDQTLEINGHPYSPGINHHWKVSMDGMRKLLEKGLLIERGKQISYPLLLEYNPIVPFSSVWDDTKWGFDASNKQYAVETNPKVIERCILMCTDPGDLVFDPTCGSGTSAFCAERYGRRWITCDTSRVAINVARKRMMSSVYDHYRTHDGSVSSGFIYKKISRISLRNLAYDLEPQTVDLVDQPEIDRHAVRVCGPFEVMTIGRYSAEDWKGFVHSGGELANYVEVLCRLYRQDAAIQGATGLIHAIAESESERIAISVGPISGRVTARQLTDAVDDAVSLGVPEVHILGWAFEANVGEVKSRLEARGRVKVELVMIRPDTLSDGLKSTRADELFSPFSVPDLEIVITKEDGRELTTVALKGVGVFDRKRRTTDYYRADSGYVSAWYLDEDYDGDCFIDCQMFYDFAKAPNLQATIKAQIEASEYKLSLASEPFESGQYRRVAVKVVDVYGNESTVVKELP